ncbi:A-kinase anchor protein 6 [Triplophysa tibetana]|uniref:A-kinase anchor protein 6 n=1 Tax=Triplophysa tibetana TaxID=1572043 RepID=A0A5A9NMD4_9TELE|nr:A-kinase anchor protein 6 [Triplophysa tibetana]
MPWQPHLGNQPTTILASLSSAFTLKIVEMLVTGYSIQLTWSFLSERKLVLLYTDKRLFIINFRFGSFHVAPGNSVEMSMWLPKKTQLLGWSESLKRSGIELPADFDRRLSALRSKWDQLEKTLAEHVEPSMCRHSQRDLLSPDTNRMVTQLETRIKELKSWLRETELFIFNLNLRPEADQCEDARDQQHGPQDSKQLQHFKGKIIKNKHPLTKGYIGGRSLTIGLECIR